MVSTKAAKRKLEASGVDNDSTVDSSASKTGKPSADVPNIVQLDPEGDAILVFKDEAGEREESFLVSSRILSLASPYSSKLFGPQFSEGNPRPQWRGPSYQHGGR